MRHLLLAALALLAVACGDARSGITTVEPGPASPAFQGPAPDVPVIPEGAGSADAGADPGQPPVVGEAPAPPALPLRLVVETPARGARLDDRRVQVVGRVTGGEAPSLKVGGQLVRPGDDGFFSAEVLVTPGLNVIVTEAHDGDRAEEDRRAVLVEADADPTGSVENAVIAHVSASGFDAIGDLLGDYLADMDLGALIAGNTPENVQITELRYGRIDVELTPRDGYLEARLAVHALHLGLRGTVTFGVSVSFSGTADADPAEIIARLGVRPTDDGGLDIRIQSADVSLHRFEYDIRHVPGFVESWFEGMVRDFAEGMIRDALASFVVPVLFDPASLDRTLEILGRPIDVGLRVSGVELRETGMTLLTSARASAGEVVHPGGAVRPQGGLPELSQGTDVDLAVAADFVTRVLHAAWAGGVLDFTLDADSGLDLPVPLTAGLLVPALGEAARGVDPRAPLSVTVRPLLPPVARVEKGERPLVIEAGDLLLDFSAPDGLMATVALHVIVRATLELDTLDQIAISPDLDIEVHADLADAPRGQADARRVEDLVEGLARAIPALIADQTFAFGADVLPVPIELDNATFDADSAAPFVHVRADLR